MESTVGEGRQGILNEWCSQSMAPWITVSSAQHLVGVVFVQTIWLALIFNFCTQTTNTDFCKKCKTWLGLKQTVASALHLVRTALGGSALALTDFTLQERLAWLPYNFSTHRLHWLLKLALLSELWPKQTVALRAAALYGTTPASLVDKWTSTALPLLLQLLLHIGCC